MYRVASGKSSAKKKKLRALVVYCQKARGGKCVRRQSEERTLKSVGFKGGTLNGGTMTGKGRAPADMMQRRKVEVLSELETMWKRSEAGSIEAGFKLDHHDEKKRF